MLNHYALSKLIKKIFREGLPEDSQFQLPERKAFNLKPPPKRQRRKEMAIDFALVLPYLAFVGFAAFGAMARTLFGIYRAYNTMPVFAVEKRRVGFEILASIFFGIFSVLILREIGLFQFGLNIAALVAGFLGADLTNLISKKLGLTKSLQVVVSRQQMENADLNERQVKAIGYVKAKGRITNKEYQRINQIARDSAKRELNSLVKRGKLQKAGYNKTTYYKMTGPVPEKAENRPGENRAVTGLSKRMARKVHHKKPGRKQPSEKPVSEPNYFG